MSNDTFLKNIEKTREAMQEVLNKFDQDSTNFWNNLTKEQQEQVFYYIIKNIMQGEQEGNSYRSMIYGKFDFDPNMYLIAMHAGYMDLHNILYGHFFNEKGKETDE